MSKLSNVKKNYIYQTLYQVLMILIPIITTPYVSRVLGAEGIGTYAYTYSVVSYFVLFAKLGIHTYGNRAIASVRDNKEKLSQTFSELMFVHVVISSIAIIVYCGYIFTIPSEYRIISVIQMFYVIGELFDINWFFGGIERFKLTVSRNAIIKVLSLVAIFLFVRTSEDIWIYCAILAVGTFLSEFVMCFFLFRFVDIVKPNIKQAVRHIKPLIAFFIPSIAVSLYKIMDKIMLGILAGTVQVGYYENSEKVIDLCLSLITSLGTVMMPMMTNLVQRGDINECKRIIESSMKFMMMISIAMSFGIISISNVLVPVFFGDDFSACIYLLMGLALTMPIKAFADVLRTQFLIPNHKDRVFQGSVIAGAVINLIFNYLFIADLKAIGAMIGTILAEFLVCIVQMFCSRKELEIRKYIKMSFPYMGAGVVMMCVVGTMGKLLERDIYTLIFQIVFGMFIYFCILGIYLFKKEKYYCLKIFCDLYTNVFKRRKKDEKMDL